MSEPKKMLTKSSVEAQIARSKHEIQRLTKEIEDRVRWVNEHRGALGVAEFQLENFEFPPEPPVEVPNADKADATPN